MYNKKTTRKNFSRKYCVFGAKSPLLRLRRSGREPLRMPIEKIGRHGLFVGYFDYFCGAGFAGRGTTDVSGHGGYGFGIGLWG